MFIKEIKEFRLTEEEKSAIIAIAKATDNNRTCIQVDCTRCPLHVMDYDEQTECFSHLATQIIARGDLRDN